jgi:lysophospholipase L1-like esterase
MSLHIQGIAIAGLVLLAAAGPGGAPRAGAETRVTGESLVLASTEPGRLFHRRVLPGSVVVRSTYVPDAPGAVVYAEGKDYVVDYEAGTVRRTQGSSIPDFSRNILYGKRDFNHTEFPGYGNLPFFVYADYRSAEAKTWPQQARQDHLLTRTRRRLAEPERPLVVCAFGDSITAGGEASAPERIYWERWLAALRQRHPKARITGINSATGGDTTVHGLARLDEKVLAHQPDLVLVAFGMNDQNVGSVPLDQFEANLNRLVDRIRANTPAEIVFLSSCLPNPAWHFTSGRMEEYGRVTARVAAARGCAFADVLVNWKAVLERKKPEDLLANNINHPNDYGHWLYFQVLDRLGL